MMKNEYIEKKKIQLKDRRIKICILVFACLVICMIFCAEAFSWCTSSSVYCSAYTRTEGSWYWGRGHTWAEYEQWYDSNSPVLDCSGFINFAMWDVYGDDFPGYTSAGYLTSSWFDHVGVDSLLPGDIICTGAHSDGTRHMGIITAVSGDTVTIKSYRTGGHTTDTVDLSEDPWWGSNATYLRSK